MRKCLVCGKRVEGICLCCGERVWKVALLRHGVLRSALMKGSWSVEYKRADGSRSVVESAFAFRTEAEAETWGKGMVILSRRVVPALAEKVELCQRIYPNYILSDGRDTVVSMLAGVGLTLQELLTLPFDKLSALDWNIQANHGCVPPLGAVVCGALRLEKS